MPWSFPIVWILCLLLTMATGQGQGAIDAPTGPLRPSWGPAPSDLLPKKEPLELPLGSPGQDVVLISFGSGIGFFPTIPLPESPSQSPFPSLEDDGSASDEGSSRRSGIPFYLGGAYTRPRGEWKVTPLFLSLLGIKGGLSPEGNLDSSYSRFDLGAALSMTTKQRGFLGISTIPMSEWTGRLFYRRSTYSSLSEGHYVVSPMISAQLDLVWRFFALGIGASEGISPSFGYTNELLWGGRQLPSSRASLRGLLANAQWLINKKTAFLFEIDQEVSQITIENPQDYTLFNLDTEGLFGSRTFKAETLITKIGFKRAF